MTPDSGEDAEGSADAWSLTSILHWPEERDGFLVTARWIPEKPDHGKWYLNFNYQLLENLRVGMDYRPLTRDASVLANWRVVSEADEGWRPGLIVGTGNDDFGDIASQSYYGTLSKYLFTVKEIDVSIYGGGTYIQELEELRPVGGVFLRCDKWSSMFMYSGVDEHWSISRDFGNHTVTFLLFDLRLPGISYAFRF